jgi:small subunit ribosomal protein S9
MSDIKPKTAVKSKERYFEAVGRRKTSVARVRIGIYGESTVNEKPLAQYFKIQRLRDMVTAPVTNLKLENPHFSAKVAGGGPKGQAEAVRHGLSRAIILQNPEFKKRLRGLGFLTRDSRMVERKKYGLKKARRAPQWAKR